MILWLLLIFVYLIVGMVTSRLVSADRREVGELTSGDELFLMIVMILWPLAFLYGILAIMATGPSKKKEKK
jgi:hypothetical protein